MRSLNRQLESIVRSIPETNISNWYIYKSLYPEINLWDQYSGLINLYDLWDEYRDQSWDWSLRSISGYRDWYKDQNRCLSQILISLLISGINTEINTVTDIEIDLRDQFSDGIIRDQYQRSIQRLLSKINLWDCYLNSISISQSFYPSLKFKIKLRYWSLISPRSILRLVLRSISVLITRSISRSMSVLISEIELWDWYRDSLIGLLRKSAYPLTLQDHTWSLRLGGMRRAKRLPWNR